jgi:hypothetical protein
MVINPWTLAIFCNRMQTNEGVSHLTGNAKRRLEMPVRLCDTVSDAQKIVDEWFPVLDEIFFFSKVQTALKVPIMVYNKPELGIRGQYISLEDQIEINCAINERKPEGGNRIVCTLAHEMVHAFLVSFSCQTRSCRRGIFSMDGGHGVLFTDSMVRIEAKLQKLVLWTAECGVNYSVIGEMEKSKSNWQPRNEELVRWGPWGQKEHHCGIGQEVSFLRHEWPGAVHPASYYFEDENRNSH